ncbi:pectate lyase [Gilvimarinus xylanilyticus]|uniref:Pectate lyase n=1 Tax=Gilvimarinus xylanilyticus TaxID=2944139 RepID=A0A9X2I548_9GAMM|nr:pectate lyase [Gilvimarinus xylanilyticus]MCP8899087.1 pectate lyase [Gilvimarinus xylanilyticus]
MIKTIFTLMTLLSLSITALAGPPSGRYVIISKLNGNALDVDSFSNDNGANVMQWFAMGGANQQFDIQTLSDGSYSIRAVHSGKSLDVWEWNADDGAELRQWDYLGGDNQRWFIDDQGGGYFSITSKFSGKSLDVWEMNMYAGADIRLFSYWGGDGQLWTFQRVGDSSECYAGATLTHRFVDCGGKTIGLSCNGDSESQDPVLNLHNSSVRNVRLAANGGADGIHCEAGHCTLTDVVWEDVCEDAATNKAENGTMTIVGGSAYNSSGGYGGSPDKIFQHNSKNSTTFISGGFTTFGEHGKLWRSCGNCTNNGGPRNVYVYDVNIDSEIGSIVGVNRNYGDRATIRNLRIRNYSSGDPKVCEEYQGVEKGSSSSKYGEYWNSASCDVSTSDVNPL